MAENPLTDFIKFDHLSQQISIEEKNKHNELGTILQEIFQSFLWSVA